LPRSPFGLHLLKQGGECAKIKKEKAMTIEKEEDPEIP
jgi:hypothetical protein